MSCQFSSSTISFGSDASRESQSQNASLSFSFYQPPLRPLFLSVTHAASDARPPGALILGKAATEPTSGTKFEGQLCVKDKADCRDLVAVGLRSKRLLGLKSIDVYSIALYVDPVSLHNELASKIKGNSAHSLAKDQAFIDSVASSPLVPKSLQIVVTSGLVNRKKLLEALRERIEPPLVRMGKQPLVTEFTQLFDGIEVKKGTSITFNTVKGGALACVIDGRATGVIQAPEVGQVLVGIYTGADHVQKDIKESFSAGIAAAAVQKK